MIKNNVFGAFDSDVKSVCLNSESLPVFAAEANSFNQLSSNAFFLPEIFLFFLPFLGLHHVPHERYSD